MQSVPSGGHLEPSQVQWLAGELAAAPADRPLIVALHHPPYSIAAHHGGSARMGAALDGAFDAAKRCPQLVLSGHVHDFQVFTRGYLGAEITYAVVGNSGYHNLHQLASDATAGEFVDDAATVRFDYGDASGWGYLKLTVGAGIAGEYVAVDGDGTVTPSKYEFTAGGPRQGW